MARKMAKETVWRIVIEKERLAVKMVLVNMFSLVKMFSLVSTILQSTYIVKYAQLSWGRCMEFRT